MKTRFLLGLILLALSALLGGNALADEVAVLDIRIGREKPLQRVIIEFYEDAAPVTVANFKKLVREKFYNGTAFHRVFPGQMVQGGDPLSESKDRTNVGTGGPGYTLPAEINRHKHTPGAVAMARLGDKVNPALVSNGSQFYIALEAMPDLDGKYTVFGNVIAGQEVLDVISRKAADTNDNPVERIVIRRARIVDRSVAPQLK